MTDPTGAVVGGERDGVGEDDGAAAALDARPAGDVLAALEAVLMVLDEPAPAVALAAAVRRPTGEVEDLLRGLAAEYAGDRGGRPRGFVLREVGGGWRVYSAPEHAAVVGAFVLEGQTARLTQAALETLAIVAYRQPVSRGRVAGVRGVNVDGVVRTLLSRGLIAEVGHDPEGGAALLGTTPYFLERFGLRSLGDLPPLAPYLSGGDGMVDLEGVAR